MVCKFLLTVLFAVGLSGVICSGSADASVVTYDLVLTPIAGSGTPLTGSGVLSVDGPVGTGLANVDALNISLGGFNFNLSGSSAAYFTKGALTDITAAGTATGDPLALIVISSLTSVVFNFDNFTYSADAISVTPLPPTWVLMLTALAVLGLVVTHRRKGKRVLAPA
jgi:hypothetical protein